MLNVIESAAKEDMPINANLGTCLVVDDSQMVRRIALKFLHEYGYHVDEAENGADAMEKCRQSMPWLVLLDWNMPVMNGLEFLIKLRQMDKGACPAVIFCTTETDVDHIRQALDAGADDYLMKPFDKEVLKQKVESMARRKAAPAVR